jgi:hypothetical protein
VRDLASHYNRETNRCLAVLNITVVKAYVATQIVDVRRNSIVGTFLLNAGADRPTRCEFDGKQCQSSNEWRALTGSTLHE